MDNQKRKGTKRRTMNILVMIEGQISREAAVAQLGKNHRLTIASSFGHAVKFLGSGRQNNPHNFDALICSLAMRNIPFGHASQVYREEQPLGMFLAILATLSKKLEWAIVYSEYNHPMTDMVNSIQGYAIFPTPITIEGIPVLFTNNHCWNDIFYIKDLSKPIKRNIQAPKTEKVETQDWKKIVQYMSEKMWINPQSKIENK